MAFWRKFMKALYSPPITKRISQSMDRISNRWLFCDPCAYHLYKNVNDTGWLKGFLLTTAVTTSSCARSSGIVLGSYYRSESFYLMRPMFSVLFEPIEIQGRLKFARVSVRCSLFWTSTCLLGYLFWIIKDNFVIAGRCWHVLHCFLKSIIQRHAHKKLWRLFNSIRSSSIYVSSPSISVLFRIKGQHSHRYELNRKTRCLIVQSILISLVAKEKIYFLVHLESYPESAYANTKNWYSVLILMISLIDLGIGYVLARYCDVTAITYRQSTPKAYDQYMDLSHMSSCPLIRIGLFLPFCCSVLSLRHT